LAALDITATEPGFREQGQPATSPMELHYIRKHASLSVLFGQHSSTGLFALRHARHITQIQEIQRIFTRFKGLKRFKKIYPWKIRDRHR